MGARLYGYVVLVYALSKEHQHNLTPTARNAVQVLNIKTVPGNDQGTVVPGIAIEDTATAAEATMAAEETVIVTDDSSRRETRVDER